MTPRLAGHVVLWLSLVALSTVLFTPGFLTTDAWAQLDEAGRGDFSDWHPPVMAWLWRHIMQVAPPRSGMLVAQLGLLWAGVLLVVSECGGSAYWQRAAAATALFLFPPVLAWAGAIGKDNWLLAGSLIAAGAVLKMARADSNGSRQAWLLCAVAACVLVCAFRHNGVFVLPGIALIGAWAWWRVDSVAAALGTAAALLVVPPLLAMLGNHVLTDHRMRPVGSLLSFDVAGIAVQQHTGRQFQARHGQQTTAALLRPGHSLAELASWYEPTDWLSMASVRDGRGEPPLPGHWTEAQADGLKALWWRLASDYPRSYLAHRWAVTASLLAIGDRPVTDPVCWRDRGAAAAADGQDTRPPVQRWMAWQLHRVIQGSVLFRPWPYYLLGLLLLLAVPVLRARWQPRTVVTACGLLVSGLLYTTAQFVISPAAEYRYSHWMMVSVVLAVWILIAATLRRSDRS